MKATLTPRSLPGVMAVASALALCGCVSTEYVGEQIKASEMRQATVDAAQNNEIAQLDGKLAEALDRVNQALAIREPGTKFTSASNSLMIGFELNGTRISAEDKTRLASLAVSLLETGQEFHLEIQGHTDSSGSVRANAEVGARRAEAVRLFLHEKGIPLRRMSTISFGDTMPLLTGDDRNTQAGNRRAEIIVFK